MWVAIIATVATAAVSVAKFVVSQAMTKRLAEYCELRDAVPKGSLARKSLDEAIDWAALKVVGQTRAPVFSWIGPVAFVIYMVGLVLVIAPVLLVIGYDRPTMQTVLQANSPWMATGLVLIVLSAITAPLPWVSWRRRQELDRLYTAEKRELVKAHSRHQIPAKQRARKPRAATDRSLT